MKRKVCVVTGTRAEYGLLKGLLSEIQRSSKLTLSIVATGAHLSPEFGMTSSEITEDGYVIDREVEVLLSSDTPTSVSRAIGLGMIGFSDAYRYLVPDIVVVLGDRYEIFAAAAAALVAGIPLAHIHGGEVTEGAIDEAFRHSITKMSHLHFAATEEYRRRIIQLGENPSRVWCVGGLGVDAIARLKLLSKRQLERSLGVTLAKRNLLVTFHPATIDPESAEAQMTELLSALSRVRDTKLLFTMPNADAGGRAIFRQIESFAKNRAHVHVFKSLGQLRYLSCMKYVDGLVGNSSSGLMEAPTLRKGTVNIGDRQKGRVRAESVIDCDCSAPEILDAVNQLFSEDFQNRLSRVTNPYGDGGAARRITEVLKRQPLSGLLKKSFYDLSMGQVVSS